MLIDKIWIKIFKKYIKYAKLFSYIAIIKLSEYIGINNQLINLEANEQASYRHIMIDIQILALSDLKTLSPPYQVTNHSLYYNLINSCKLIDNNLF